MSKKQDKNRGPKPNHLQIEGDWEKSIKQAIQKKKPKEGWPEKGKKKPD